MKKSIQDMKNPTFTMLPNDRLHGLSRRFARFGMAAVQAAIIGLGATIAIAQEEASENDEQGAQVLTRGPIHEAFAGIVSYNPEAGVVVEQAPPEAIEEVPPEIRPAGENISWIPGYWAWDDERTDYLWISGTWRALPPGRQWTTGYWNTTGQGYQWISGYWADSSVQEVTYLPKPPVTVEAGPNVEAPSRNHSWTPGSWLWQQERYAWRPGYWAEGRSDWDWIPAHYVWTPRGYVFVDGYWDHSFDQRGVIYAPVYFQSGYASRPGYSYTPAVAIGLAAIVEHLFLRPNYHHYYFGDYYGRSYRDSGYYSPYAYQSSRYGYDPVYSYRRWTHREDRDWERRYEASYDYRRDHESARPPRTWADQKRLRLDTAEARAKQLLMATPFNEMAKRRDNPVRIERVAEKEREKFKVMSREVRKTREQRRTLEAEAVAISPDNTEREFKPTKARLPASPIVGRSLDRLDEKQSPPRPHRPPGADPEKAGNDRRPDADKNRPGPGIQPEPDASDPKGKTSPAREAVPDSKKQPPERRADRPTRKEPQAKEPKRDPRPEPQAKEPKRDPRPEPQAKEPKRDPRPEPQAEEPKRDPRPEPQAKEPKREPRPEPQTKEPKRDPRPEPQAKEPKREPRPEPQTKEPKREPRPEPQAKEPKREPRPKPQAKEPKREPRPVPQAKEPRPSSRTKPEPDKEDSKQPAGKSRKK
jgi:hypothetical protein